MVDRLVLTLTGLGVRASPGSGAAAAQHAATVPVAESSHYAGRRRNRTIGGPSGEQAPTEKHPPAVLAWIFVVVASGLGAVVGVLALVEGAALDVPIAATFGLGVIISIQFALRYRLGGSTHALTADEALLVALLLAMPGGWPPLILSGAVVIGNVMLRRPLIRMAFNFGMVGFSAAMAAATYLALVDGAAPFTWRSLGSMAVAMLVYAIVSGLFIAVLFRRLGSATISQSVHDILPVRRVTLPANLAAGFGLGWLATEGIVHAMLGVGLLAIVFGAYRTAVGAQQQRDRAARLRDVSRQLVLASGSLEAFDGALGKVAGLFGARAAELHLIHGQHRLVDVENGRAPGSRPGPTAIEALSASQAVTHPPGTPLGGTDGAMATPLIVDGAAVGSLVLHARRGLEPWEDADEDVLDGVAGEILVALQNAELVEEVARERSQLARQTEVLEGILDAASDGIALIAANGRVLAWNPAMSSLAGTRDEQVLDAVWTDVMHVTDEQGLTEGPVAALEAATSGATLSRTWRIRPKAGEERWVRVVLSPATTGGMRAAVVVAHDVTAAREVDRLKADFIATVSHELRTPLTPIKGFIELDGRGALEPERRSEMLGLMRRQVERLEVLIEDLLSMAQLDRDLVDVAQEPVPLREVVTRVHMKHVTTGRVMPHSEPVVVIGDIEAMVKIVDALVDNALKHTEGAVQVTIGQRDGAGTVTVKDHGPGIAATDQEVIFERFSRLGDHLLRTQGPGLGLPIARALARRLGGDVTVESARGEGATFEVWLPLA